MKPLRIKPGPDLLLFRLPTFALLVFALVLCAGCFQKKPAQTTATAPPPVASPTPAPPEPAPPQSATAGQPAQETPQTEQAQTAQKKPDKKPLPRKPRPVAKKPAPTPTPQEKPVEEAKNLPPRPLASLAPGPVKSDAAHDQAATDQLLQTAENNLNGLKRQLTKDEEDVVTQIKAFIAQSREASKNNDQVRAYNLAVKAQLLSDALAKPK
jgi:outer membrane biosynthesis protein TonB